MMYSSRQPIREARCRDRLSAVRTHGRAAWTAKDGPQFFFKSPDNHPFPASQVEHDRSRMLSVAIPRLSAVFAFQHFVALPLEQQLHQHPGGCDSSSTTQHALPSRTVQAGNRLAARRELISHRGDALPPPCPDPCSRMDRHPAGAHGRAKFRAEAPRLIAPRTVVVA